MRNKKYLLPAVPLRPGKVLTSSRHTHDGQQEIDFDDHRGKEIENTERFLSCIDNVLISGTRFLLDQGYDSIGFNIAVRQNFYAAALALQIAGDPKFLKEY